MAKSIILVIIGLVLAISAIIINPKKDNDKSIIKLRPLGYFVVFILLIFSVIQIWQISDDNGLQEAEKSRLLAKSTSDSIYQQEELEERNKLILKNEKIIKLQDTTLKQQRYIVELQKELLLKSQIENKNIRDKLDKVEQKSDRSNHAISSNFDISVLVPLDDYSCTRDTKYQIPLTIRSVPSSKEPIACNVPNFSFFTDSVYLNILKNEFGHSIWLDIAILKPDSIDFIRTTCELNLQNIDTLKSFRFWGKWCAKFNTAMSDSIECSAFSMDNDRWWLNVKLKGIPLDLVHHYPKLSYLDLTSIGTWYIIKHNSVNKKIKFEVTIKDDYNSYIGKFNWKSKTIENDNSWRDSINPIFKNIIVEYLLTESYTAVESEKQWLTK